MSTEEEKWKSPDGSPISKKPRSYNYQPDNWVIIRVDSPTYGVFFKLVSGWSGSYLNGNSYRVNSGITKIVLDNGYYYVYGHSGSVYKCHKESECIRMNIAGVLDTLLKLDGVTHVPIGEAIDHINKTN